MLSNRLSRRAALALALGLAGCGLRPVQNGGGDLYGTIGFDTPGTVAGFRLRTRLEERLGRSTAPDLTLRVRLSSRQRAAAVASDGDTVRSNLVGTATWSLQSAATGAIVDAGEVEAFTSFSSTASTVATQATRDDAEARLSVLLADMIIARLLARATQGDP